MGNSESELDIKSRENIAKIEQMCKPKKRIKIYQRVAAVAACLALVFGGNAYTLNAYGENLFSLLITRDSSGVVINFNYDEKNNIKLPKIKNDPYGMIAKCAEYGVYPDTPLYIPDGFELDHIDINNSPYSMSIKFFLKKNDIILNIRYDKWYESEDIPPQSIISDELNITEITVNGTIGVVSKEKNSLNKVTDQYTLKYYKNNIIYFIYSDGLDYDECDKIVESITQNPLTGGEEN